jgi:hypothetical protein
MCSASSGSSAAGDGPGTSTPDDGDPTPGDRSSSKAEPTELTDSDAAALRAVAEGISDQFPLVFQGSALVLYDVDPEHLQAQWQLHPEDVARARRLFPAEAGAVHAELRLQRIRGDGSREAVTSVPGDVVGPDQMAGARFALQNDSADYEAELGLASETGGWVALLRSNRMQLPPLARVHVAPAPISLEAEPGPAQPRAEAGPAQERPSTMETRPPPHLDTEGAAAGARAAGDLAVPAYVEEEAIRAWAAGEIEPALAAQGPALHPVFPNPLVAVAEGAGEAVAPPRATGEAAVIGAPQPPAQTVERTPGAWPELPPPLLPSTAEPHFPLYDPRTALSSPALMGPRKPDEELDVHAELMIYGRATPGSVIDLFGHSLTVGDTGHFFVRRSVRDQQLLRQALSDLPDRLPAESLAE